MNEKKIIITGITVEESKKGFEIIYIPSRTQTLIAGMKYKFVFGKKGVPCQLELSEEKQNVSKSHSKKDAI